MVSINIGQSQERGTPRRIVANESSIPNSIIERVLKGMPIVYPTSSLPALGCIPESSALDALFECKNRDEVKVVSLGVSTIQQAAEIVELPPDAEMILNAFEPGSLTLILPAKEKLDERLGGNSVAVRVLSHPSAKALTSITGPLTATSANQSGYEASADCIVAAQSLNLPKEAVLQGKCVGGAPSTLIAWNVSDGPSNATKWTVVREGKISQGEILSWLKKQT